MTRASKEAIATIEKNGGQVGVVCVVHGVDRVLPLQSSRPAHAAEARALCPAVSSARPSSSKADGVLPEGRESRLPLSVVLPAVPGVREGYAQERILRVSEWKRNAGVRVMYFSDVFATNSLTR